MSLPFENFVINTPEQLASLFEPVAVASLKKEVPFIHPRGRQTAEVCVGGQGRIGFLPVRTGHSTLQAMGIGGPA